MQYSEVCDTIMRHASDNCVVFLVLSFLFRAPLSLSRGENLFLTSTFDCIATEEYMGEENLVSRIGSLPKAKVIK